MNDLENLLRDVFHDLAAEAPAPGPDRAEVALDASRHRRRGAVLLAAAAVVLVVVGALAVPRALDRASGPVPASTPTDTPEPGSGPPPAEPLPALPVVTGLRLTAAARTGAYQLTSYGTAKGTAVRPPGETTFRLLPWTNAAVSPTGRIAVVDTTDATPGARIGIIESLAQGTIRWFDSPVPILNPVWSPDGRQVLVTMFDNESVQASRDGFEILDVDGWTMQQGGFAQRDDSTLGPQGLGVTWGPGGDSVVGAVELPYDYTDVPKFGLRSWEVDGTELNTVRTAGAPIAYGTQLLSPSGTKTVIARGRTGIAIAAVKTGGTIATPPSPSQIVYGWVDEGDLVTEGPGGLVLLAMDGSTRPYASRVGSTALFGKAGVSYVTA